MEKLYNILTVAWIAIWIIIVTLMVFLSCANNDASSIVPGIMFGMIIAILGTSHVVAPFCRLITKNGS